MFEHEPLFERTGDGNAVHYDNRKGNKSTAYSFSLNFQADGNFASISSSLRYNSFQARFHFSAESSETRVTKICLSQRF